MAEEKKESSVSMSDICQALLARMNYEAVSTRTIKCCDVCVHKKMMSNIGAASVGLDVTHCIRNVIPIWLRHANGVCDEWNDCQVQKKEEK